VKSKKTKSKSFYKKLSKKYYIPAVILLLAGIFYLTPVKGIVAQKLLAKGNFYFNGGAYDLEKAVKWYNAALFVDHNYSAARYQLARVFFVQNKLQEAKSEIDKAITVNSGSKKAYYIRGLINGYSGSYQEAIADFSQVVKMSPEAWAGYNDLAWVYYENKDYENAKATLEKGLEVESENPWLLNGLGAALLAQKKYSEAEDVLGKADQAAKKLNVREWKMAYPGNDPASAEWDLGAFKTSIQSNRRLALFESPEKAAITPACSYSCDHKCLDYVGTLYILCDDPDHPTYPPPQWSVEEYNSSSCPYCGDGRCTEGCDVCVADCGTCCTDSSWSPDPSTICLGVSFTQTSNCGNTRGATGTATCNGACGGANGGAATCTLGSPLCSSAFGSSAVSPPSPWSWTCFGVGPGHTDASCSHNQLVVTPDCGNSAALGAGYCNASEILAPCKGVPYFPVSNPDSFTYVTTPPGIRLIGSNFSWSCSSSCNGATSGTCTAAKLPPIVPKCGSADGSTSCEDAPSSNLCDSGIASTPTGGAGYRDWEWTCTGQCPSTVENCSAKGPGSCGWVETN